MKIGTNIHAMQAYSVINNANRKIMASNRKMTTGLRINSAGDDPVTLTTATKLQMQLKGYGKAAQNASNAISLMQTAEGAVNSIVSMVQRMRELSVQASSETNSSEDLLKIQEEISQLKTEVDDMIRKADYNGIKVLSGDAASMEYKYTINDTATNTKLTLGTPTLGELPNSELRGDIVFSIKDIETIPPIETNITVNLNGTEDLTAMLKAFTDKFTPSLTVNPSAAGDYSELESISVATPGNYKLTVSGEDFLLNALGLSTFSGSVYERGKTEGINLVTQAEDPRSPLSDEAICIGTLPNITIRDNLFSTDPTYKYGFTSNVTVDSSLTSGEIGTFSEISTQKFVIQIGAQKGTEMDISIPKISSTILGLDRVNLTNTDFSVKSMKLLDGILTDVVAIRSKIGSYLTRLEKTLGGLETGESALTSSYSRLMDTDLAVEMSEYTQQNVVIQAALSVIVQANQRPAEVAALFSRK